MLIEFLRDQAAAYYQGWYLAFAFEKDHLGVGNYKSKAKTGCLCKGTTLLDHRQNLVKDTFVSTLLITT